MVKFNQSHNQYNLGVSQIRRIFVYTIYHDVYRMDEKEYKANMKKRPNDVECEVHFITRYQIYRSWINCDSLSNGQTDLKRPGIENLSGIQDTFLKAASHTYLNLYYYRRTSTLAC